MAARDGRDIDEPPNSRLFILCQKGTTEQDFRSAFDRYGTIEDVWIIKDKRTNEDRGIVYIKFAKTSEAMQAMEEMNGKALPGTAKGLKVVVANSKREGSTRDPREDERLVRLFVIIPKHYSEKDLKDEFSKFGEVESVTILKDRGTGENKGFGYVRYYKPLHAALAYENCDPSYRPKFAEPQRSRDEREEYENHGYYHHQGSGQKRMYEEEYHAGGGYYNNDGFGFQGYNKKIENRVHPHVHRHLPDTTVNSRMSLGIRKGYSKRKFEVAAGPAGASGPVEMLADYPVSSNCSRLIIQAPIGLTQGYLSRLFNLIPGMEYCDLNEVSGIAYARYSSPQCAAYAKDKLNGFEYPLGSALHVQLADESARQDYQMNSDSGGYSQYSNAFRGYNNQGPAGSLDSMDIRQKAAMILERAGINPHNLLNLSGAAVGPIGDGRKELVPYCSIPLPPSQPTVTEEGKNMAQRLFIVCQPSGVSERILKDAFCRFGNLIDVYLLSGRNYGYAKFASKECAMKAIETLHGQTLAGQKLKVLEAEPPKTYPGHGGNQGDEGPSKKQKL